ncbi:MAG: PEP-CTERM sorting domain-containing protein [Burkholderiales bacterium]|nr:PEP-CTERM sorting domain-containing protein [Burkholderiales bacterium]
MRTSLSIAVLMSVLAMPTAGAVVLDFESLAHNDADAIYLGPSYVESGFTLTSSVDPLFADQAFGVWGSGSSSFNGSTALFNANAGFVTRLTLTADGGEPFALESIDVGPLFNDGAVGDVVTIFGLTADGITVSENVTFGPELAPRTHVFGDAFASLTSVSWEQSGQLHQFDNVVLTTAIPEPGNLLLLAGGLLVLAGGMRRRRRSGQFSG